MTIYLQDIFYIFIIIFLSCYYTNVRRRLTVKHIYINNLLTEIQDTNKANEIIKYDCEKTKTTYCDFLAYLADKYDSEKAKDIVKYDCEKTKKAKKAVKEFLSKLALTEQEKQLEIEKRKLKIKEQEKEEKQQEIKIQKIKIQKIKEEKIKEESYRRCRKGCRRCRKGCRRCSYKD